MNTLLLDAPQNAQAEIASRLSRALRDPDYGRAEDALLAWLTRPDCGELDRLASSLIERDARRLGHLLDLMLQFELVPGVDSERLYRVLDDLRDRTGIDHDQPLDERWNADRTFNGARLAQRLRKV